MNWLMDRLNLLFHGAGASAYLMIPAILLGQREYSDVICIMALSLLVGVVLSVLVVVVAVRIQHWLFLRRIDQYLEGGSREP